MDDPGVINLISSEEEEEAPKIYRKRRPSNDHKQSPSKSKKDDDLSSPNKHENQTTHNDNTDDIELVSHVIRGPSSSAPKREKVVDPFMGPISASRAKGSKGRTRMLSPPRALTTEKVSNDPQIRRTGGEAVELVGVTKGVQALVDYPHFRFQCALEPFKRARAAKKEKYCPRCYCYVCDVLASECREWTSHSKAVDTVPRWRAKREAKLEERKRREQCLDTQKRGTMFARYSVPQRVSQKSEEDSSEDDENEDDESFNSSDAMEWTEDCHPSDKEEEEENYKRCEFDSCQLGVDKIVLEKDCFQMGGMDQLLQSEDIERSSAIRRRHPVLDGSCPGF